jgi:hypothetical protein
MVTRFTATDNRLSDDEPLYFGDNQDASLVWDGTQLLIKGNVVVGGALDSIGFFDTTPAVQPTVTDFNNFATLADVVAALQILGLFETP